MKKKKTTSPKTKKEKAAPQGGGLHLIEKRKHPRFLLSGEQFKEVKSRRIFSVYDLSLTGFSIKTEEQYWTEGSVVAGVLNLHPESIEVSGRLLGYYGDRAALKFEIMSTYSRSSLARSLSAQRLGKNLVLVKEKLSFADLWFHGVCSTDILVTTSNSEITGTVSRFDIFFSNYYCGWTSASNHLSTGICQSVGKEKIENLSLSQEPVTLESLQLEHDQKLDLKKAEFAKAIVEASLVDPKIKKQILERF